MRISREFARLSFVLTACAMLAPTARAGGQLDPSFGVGGKVAIDIGTNSTDDARAVALDASGNIYVAGVSDASGQDAFTVVKLDSSGGPDPAFGSGGAAIANIGSGNYEMPFTMALSSSGDVFVGGTSNIAGSPDMTVIKFNASGEVDTSYGDGGRALIDFGGGDSDYLTAMVIDEGEHLFGVGETVTDLGYEFAVAKLDSTGLLDPDFGDGGRVIVGFDDSRASDYANAVVRDDSGNLYVAGTVNLAGESSDIGILKLDSAGNLVTDFGVGGKAVVHIGNADLGALTRDARGNLYVAGQSYGPQGISVAKLDPSGRLARNFGNGGTQIIQTQSGDRLLEAHGVAIDRYGDIYLTGESLADDETPNFVAIQLDQRANRVRDFGTEGVLSIDFGGLADISYASALDADGHLYLAGIVNSGVSPIHGDFGVAKLLVTPPRRMWMHSRHQR